MALCPQPLLALWLFLCSLWAAGAACGRSALVAALRWALPLALLVALANPLLSPRGTTVLFRIAGRPVLAEAAVCGLVNGLMLTSCALLFQGLFARVGASGIVALLGRRLPVTALVLSMGLGQVPLLLGRAQRLQACAKAQGAAGGRGLSVAQVSSRLVAWSLDDTLTRADSMRARGWGTGPRTSVDGGRPSRAARAQTAVAALAAAAAVAGAAAAGAGWRFYPTMPPLLDGWPLLLVPALFGLWPVLLALEGRLRPWASR